MNDEGLSAPEPRGGAAGPHRSRGDPAEAVVLLVEGGRASGRRPARDAVVVTPNPRAARAAGARPVSLERLARDELRPMGLQPASELARWRALRHVVQDVWHAPDVDGSARALAPTVREVLRAGLPPDASGADAAAPRSERLERVLALTRAYRARLLDHRLVDPAEALWWAADRRGPTGAAAAARRASGRALHVIGYPRIGAAEVAFLAAVAGPGSVLELPGRDGDGRTAGLFADSERAAADLAARGWRVERVDPLLAARAAPAAPDAAAAGAASSTAAPSTAAPSAAAPSAAAPDAAPSGSAPAGDALPVGAAPDAAAAPAREPAPSSAPAPQEGRRQAWRLPSRDAEVRTVLTEVKRLLAAGATPTDIVLVSRDDAAYGPLVRDVAWEYELPVVASYAVPLEATPVGAWTTALAEAVRDDLPFETVARLLAHPLSDGLPAETWDAARTRHPRGLGAWSPIDARASLLAWPRRATRATFHRRLTEAWDAFGVRRRARGTAADALAFQRLETAAAALALPAEEELARAAFLHDVGALTTLLAVPVDVGRSGVELHTPLAIYGARYRHVFVLGAVEGALPRPVSDDPVLDFAERRAALASGLALEGAVEAARREALSFRAVVWAFDRTERPGSPAPTFTLTFPEDRGVASPYIRDLGLEPSVPGPKPAASEEEERRRGILGAADDPVTAAARRALEVERRREQGGAPDAFDGVVGEAFDVRGHVFSATQLLSLGQCAFRWFAQVPLKLAAPEEADEEVSPLLRGRLYHLTLARALSVARVVAGPAAPAAAVRAAALAALDEAFASAEEELAATSVPAWPVRREHELRQLRRVLRAESFLPDGAEIVALERRFPAPGDPPVAWRGFRVRGIVDRADRRERGLTLVDYKTRASPPVGAQDDSGRARLDLQLPLYVEAAAPSLFGGEVAAGAEYYSLTKGETLRSVTIDAELDAQLAAFADRTLARLAAGAYPVAPDVDWKACAYCDFDAVCRKGPRTERMRGDGAFDPPGGDAREPAERGGS